MITTSSKTSYSYLRRIFAIPVALLVFGVFSFSVVNAQIDPLEKKDTRNYQIKKQSGRSESY